MGFDGKGCDGKGWDGMGRDGIGWDAMGYYIQDFVTRPEAWLLVSNNDGWLCQHKLARNAAVILALISLMPTRLKSVKY
eukprot:scaffold402090_cov20-Prasinocladus_malaysianus.AAC.1